MQFSELKGVCKQRGLPASGSKGDMIKRILAHQPQLPSMEVDDATKKYFAFDSFPMSADPQEICVVIQEYAADLPGECSLEVCEMATGEESRSVAVKLKVSDEDGLSKKVTEMRKHFVFCGAPLQGRS